MLPEDSAVSKIQARRWIGSILPGKLEAFEVDLTGATISSTPLDVPPEEKEAATARSAAGKKHAPKYALANANDASDSRRGGSVLRTNGVRGGRRTVQGHLFCAHLSPKLDSDSDFVCADDPEGDVATLLAKELRRVARTYQRLARELEGHVTAKAGAA